MFVRELECGSKEVICWVKSLIIFIADEMNTATCLAPKNPYTAVMRSKLLYLKMLITWLLLRHMCPIHHLPIQRLIVIIGRQNCSSRQRDQSNQMLLPTAPLELWYAVFKLHFFQLPTFSIREGGREGGKKEGKSGGRKERRKGGGRDQNSLVRFT